MSLLSRLAVQAAKAYGALSKGGVSASYLVVAGGAGGGCSPSTNPGGGGGSGGLLTSTVTLSTLTTYTVTVGAGGAGATATNSAGAQGGSSILSGTGITTITTNGGGGGCSGTGAAGTGGSGGGGGYSSLTGGAGNTPATTPSQGFAGGNGTLSAPGYTGGGGGGSGSVGVNGTGSAGGNGGNGTASSISGSSVTYAGGGGGGGSSPSYPGGTGQAGGGNGSMTGVGNSATVNTGSGGGGAGFSPAGNGGAGGSGIVIISYTSATPKFVGGTITTSGGNQIHTFTSSGTLSPLTPVTASYLVVAGGAGGGFNIGGGGGAGGLQTSSTTIYSGATYVVTVGAGGAGSTTANTQATSGVASSLAGTGITTVSSAGGGGGGSGPNVNAGNSGAAGGSGGGGSGGAGSNTGGTGNTPSTSPSQGNTGGVGEYTAGPYYGAGGGGGASAVGVTGTGAGGGNGGAGTASSITGSSVTYAGGGGGGNYNGGTAGSGGTGGGGAGSVSSTTATAGTINLGGGGGGGGRTAPSSGAIGGAGGSGTVIISYAGSQVFNGGLVTTSGGNTIHTFNATGALTPVTNNLNNSLRFRASSPGYLSRTPSIAGNTQKWTWSAWIKLGKLSTFGGLFGALNGTDRMYIAYNSSAKWQIFGTNAGTDYVEAFSTGLYRDPSAWYHLVIAVDTTQATASNRLKMYVNGNQETVSFTTNMTLNANTSINKAIATVIGETSVGSDPFDGYMTDINFIDGQQLEPYYFGNNDAYGNWKPIKYTGMYGTNGFYLTFADTSALTTTSNAGLGKDTSGNGNYWATSGISITSGVTYDAMLDVPTNTSATVANYCTLNPLIPITTTTVINGNLGLSSYNPSGSVYGTIGVTSGKWYYEMVAYADALSGIAKTLNGGNFPGQLADSYCWDSASATKINNSTGVAYGAATSNGDIVGVAFDLDVGTLTFYKNNVSQGTAYTFTPSGTYFPVFRNGSANNTSVNFGQRPFTYTAPSGFVALNTYNLPTPTILQGNKYMDATLYTGTGTTQVLVNQGQFKPDFVWLKGRNVVSDHAAYDSVRGVTQRLEINSTGAENTELQGVTAFNSNGVTIGTMAQINQSPYTFVGWQWQAGQGSTSSNTSGSITSTVSVNTTAGFSVVTYTGNGTAGATIGHGLGVAPKMIIVKDRGTTDVWMVYHSSLGATKYIILNLTSAAATLSTVWNNTEPTSSVFSVGTVADTNRNTFNLVAYCWAEIAGFSKFGSYTGNGSTDGPFVYTGFRPKFVMVKPTIATGSWQIEDTARNTYNVMDGRIFAEDTSAEVSNGNGLIDYLSNGFKPRVNHPGNNGSGEVHIHGFCRKPI